MNFLDCRNARRQFDPFLLGELGNERKTELESHLQNCTSCQQQWQEFQQFISLVQGVLATIPPPQAMARVSLGAVSRPRNRVVRVAGDSDCQRPLIGFCRPPIAADANARSVASFIRHPIPICGSITQRSIGLPGANPGELVCCLSLIRQGGDEGKRSWRVLE